MKIKNISCRNNKHKPQPHFAFKKSVVAMSGVLLTTMGNLPLHAEEGADLLEEVVVTGTLIRGIKPTGSQTIGIETEAIEISGAQSANEILTTLPQADNLFNSRPTLNPRAQDKISVVRPNLRGLPGFEQASGSATLILLDGHRIVGMGVNQSSPDPDIVPPALIERVEIITDGGSSLYGADAVGGVINFVTKKEFEGVQIDAGYNVADNYWSYDTNITAGTSWDDGSAYIAFTRSDRDSLLGKDRDWAAQGNWTDDGLVPADTECLSPVGTTRDIQYRNIIAAINVWDNRAFTEQAIGERCDRSAQGTLFPAEDRESMFLGLSQELNDNVSLNLKGFYSERNTTFEDYPLGASSSFGPEQFSPTPVAPIGEIRQQGSVGFSFGAHPSYQHRDRETNLQAWGITPELIIDMNNGWQLRNTLHYSRSDNEFFSSAVNSVALNQAVADGSVDPSDIASADSAVIANILDQEFSGESEQELFLLRAVTDGAVLELPAGEMRLAAGFEFSEQRNRLRQGTGVFGHLNDLEYRETSRDVKSFFAEVNIPLVSGVVGVESLTLSASARYDEYSDFGTTTNPHIGLSWQPVDWISVHANWGESFVAPTLVDELNAEATYAFSANAVGIIEPSAVQAGVTIEPGRTDVTFLTGAQPDLDPQTAETWAVGFEMLPPAVEGLLFSVNYYEIEFVDLLGSINPQLSTAAVLFPDRYTFNPTPAQIEAAAEGTINGEAVLAGITNPGAVAAILDLRQGNTDEATLKGFDFNISYQHITEIGEFSYSLSGTHRTEFELVQGGVVGDELEFGKPETLATASVGWRKGNWRTNLSLKYTDGFDVEDAQQGQTSVDSFEVVDLFVGYDFQGTGLTEDLSIRFNVDNVFDEDPPVYRLNNQPAYRGFTLGRAFGIGFTKTFN